jgi:RTX calcium-binding nonapeptide repeat (4 copies)
MSVRGLGKIAVPLAFAWALLAPAGAMAATTCDYDGSEIFTVRMTAPNDSAILRVTGGTNIAVNSGSEGPISCSGGTATLTNTDFVRVLEEGAGSGTSVSILNAPEFASGPMFLLANANGSNTLQVFGVSAPVHFVLGVQGIDADGDGTKDISFLAVPETVRLFATAGADTISARGSLGTGAAFSASSLELSGGAGNDTLEGGEQGDILEGEEGEDVLRGFGGNDRLIGDSSGQAADDSFDGGAGSDTYALRFNVLDALTIDLGKTTPQDTGFGTDTIVNVENAEGTDQDDTLIGSAGPNRLAGNGGSNLLEGKGGDDELDGSGASIDTVSYADAPSGVSVDLSSKTASGGDGTDALNNIDNVIGSRFGDNLTGNDEANVLTPGLGGDVVRALGGDDTVQIRDGVPDNASCGAGADKAVSDRRSLDVVQADCEIVDAIPEAEVAAPSRASQTGTASGGGGTTPPDRALVFRLQGSHQQRLLAQQAIVVTLRCPQENCTVAVGAKGNLATVKRVNRRVFAAKAKTLKLRLSSGQRAAIAAALAAGRKPKLKVSAVATDAAGNRVKRTLVVTAR